MEGFTYVNIFATKGIEYLIIISVLLLFIPFWKSLVIPAKAIYRAAGKIIPAISEWFRTPLEGIFYHQGHCWALPEKNNVVKVGIDDFAQKLVGQINAVKTPKVGATLTQGERGWALKVGSKYIDMLSPVNGKVVAINEKVLNSPNSINNDPYGEGWLAKVQVPKVSSTLSNLLSGNLAQKWMEGVREKLFSRMDYNLGTVSQDGGVPVNGIARSLDKDKWDELVRDFFLTP